ncbi:MAG: hypothetical protein LBD55_03820 [Treponema sp.]|jgi:hypothetical protein|nr:hypothetical protein [Treponema sp.]
MMRIEIVANRSVEENLLEAFRDEGVGKYYTKYPSVLGIGSTGPRMGDAIWPEENFALVIWCEEAEAQGIERAIGAVKKQFPDEGIKLFKPEATQVIYTGPSDPAQGTGSNASALLPAPPLRPVSGRSYGPEAENN